MQISFLAHNIDVICDLYDFIPPTKTFGAFADLLTGPSKIQMQAAAISSRKEGSTTGVAWRSTCVCPFRVIVGPQPVTRSHTAKS